MMPNIAGTPVKTCGRPRRSMTSPMPACIARPVRSMVRSASVSRRIDSTFVAAAAATRLPA
jgi:hypothetical protein